MSRILLADDSAHAQRMGVRILREEGLEVVSVTDGETAVVRLADADPDLILADVFLPGRSGLELCRYVKEHPKHRHARVVLTAGILDTFDEDEAKQAGCDAIIRKPFEASIVVRIVRPLLKEAEAERAAEPQPVAAPETVAAPEVEPTASEPPPEPQPEPEPVAAAPEPEPLAVAAAEPEPEPVPEIDDARVRAAVTVALDAAFPALIDELTSRVLAALRR